MCRDKGVTTMRSSLLASQMATRSDLRRQQALAIVAKAYGATDPHSVATSLDPGCADVPGAIAALRHNKPEWFTIEPRRRAGLSATASAALTGAPARPPR
jgi:hypothetical protein